MIRPYMCHNNTCRGDTHFHPAFINDETDGYR